MLRNIFLKTIRDRRVSLLGWSLGLAALVLSIAGAYPAIHESAAEFIKYAESLPDAVKSLAGTTNMADLATPTGFLSAELFSLMAPLMFVIFSIGLGSSALAGEEEQRTLDLLLANPVSRRRLVLEKFLAVIVSTALLGIVLWLSLVFCMTIFNISIAAGKLAAASAASVMLSLSFGTIAFAVGCLTGRRSTAIAAATSLAAGSYILNLLAKLVDSLKDFERFSLFYYQMDINPLKNGLGIGDIAPFLGVIVVFLIIGAIGFERRDLAS